MQQGKGGDGRDAAHTSPYIVYHSVSESAMTTTTLTLPGRTGRSAQLSDTTGRPGALPALSRFIYHLDRGQNGSQGAISRDAAPAVTPIATADRAHRIEVA